MQQYTNCVTDFDIDALLRARRRFELRNHHTVFVDSFGKTWHFRFRYELTARVYALMMRWPPFVWGKYFEKF